MKSFEGVPQWPRTRASSPFWIASTIGRRSAAAEPVNSFGVDHGAVGEDLKEHAELAAVIRAAQGHAGQERVGRGHGTADARAGRQAWWNSPEPETSGVDGSVRDRSAGRSRAGARDDVVAGGNEGARRTR